MSEQRLLHHATRMAMVTVVSRVAGYLRDKALAWALGAGPLNDAFRTAFRIPNAFRALLAEGALHAAFVPMLSRLDGEESRARARDLVGGLVAVLTVVLAVVVGLGILLAPWLVRLYGEGFVDTPGKLAVTVLMNRLMFPYLGAISLAALCQAVLNSRERFLLPAATPVLFNLMLAAVAWTVLRDSERAPVILGLTVVVGGVLQFAVQVPSVRRLGFSLRPLWRAIRTPEVRQVVLLMLPGIPVLGINQLNQLITNRFASFLGDGAVTATFYAYRITELMFGGIVVQLTTVLLPVLSRQLREAPSEAPRTLLDTVRLVAFVTLPTAVVLVVAARPIVGLLFGGGAFGSAAVAVTGSTLAAYAFGLVGTGHAKVMASSFFAQQNTRTPMWASAGSLAVFTVAAWLLTARFGVPGLGLANTVAMLFYAALLSGLYARRYGVGGTPLGPTAVAIGRQLVVSVVIGLALWSATPWLVDVERTGAAEALRLLPLLAAAGAAYVGLVAVLGGREPAALLQAVRRRRAP